MAEETAARWWHSLVACPRCGGDPAIGNMTGRVACRVCGRTFEALEYGLDWPRADGEPRVCEAPKNGRERLKRALHPLSNPLLPFRYWSQYRIDAYYRRTLAERGLAERWRDHYLKGISLPPGAIILEHGCGRGRHLALLNQLGFRTVGQDITPHPWWRRLSASGFQTASPAEPNLPWTAASFDMVLDVGVIHYMSDAALRTYAGEVARVLKPGGYWLLLEANSNSVGRVAFQFERMHSLDATREIASAHGLQERDLSYEGFYSPILPLVINFCRKQCAPWPLDMTDHRSWLARRLVPERRGLWLLRLQAPAGKSRG